MEKHMIKVLSLLLVTTLLANAQTSNTFQIGVILDADTLVGKIGLTSLSLALSDVYAANANFSTRLALHVRDSGGQVTGAAASALNLLKDVQVDAIIGPQKSGQANFVISLGDTAKVPIISYSATSPSLHPRTPYFVQTALSDAAQANAIASVVSHFQWHQLAFVYEDSDYGNGIIPYLSNAFQEANARVSYKSVIPVSPSDDLILRELYKMKTMQTRVFVVHLSRLLASRFFVKAKEAGMMSEGYAWIVTSEVMDLFYSLDKETVDAIQGVVGVKPLLPLSGQFRSTNVRWRTKFSQENPTTISQPEMGMFGLWAYDTLWALALAAEKIGPKEQTTLQNTTDLNSTNMFVTQVSQTGPKLLRAMLDTTYKGLGGNFRLVDGQLEPSYFQIMNVDGYRLREVGVWSPSTGISNERRMNVVWPGGSTAAPKGWEIPVSGKKLRVGVPAEAGFTEFVKVEKDPQTNATKIVGYYIDLFDAVMAALPYAVRYDYVPFQTANGSIAGSYDDLSYQVFNGAIYAAVGDITITAKRSQYVDFSLPIEEGGITITQKIEGPNDERFFLKPLTRELWLTAIALFVLTGFCLWLLEHRLNKAFRGPASEHVGLIFYIPFMSLVFAQRERIVSNLARLVIVVWLFVVLILSSTYTASLAAKFTAVEFQKANTNVDELITNGDYVGCREGSFIVSYLKRLGFDDSKIKKYKSPKEFDVALTRGSKHGGIKAMFSRTPYSNLFLSTYCNKYTTTGSPYLTEGFAFVLPKGSPLVADVSRAIIELTDNGRISEIKGRWFKQSACSERHQSDAVNKISLKSFKILFGITGAVTATCLVVFLASYLYQNRDFLQRISTSGATTWSKIRAMCKHFDQRDPKSFRSGRAREDGDQTAPTSPARWSTVVPVSSEEMPRENQVFGPNTDNSSANAEQVRSV